ncbi:hypothetical protein AB0R12_37990, partial [Streptomyces niveus]|uniref:hypothetical protein n=1 Tax=Streptomyces niveus TaxID=193462 RepID=UPI00341EBB98
MEAGRRRRGAWVAARSCCGFAVRGVGEAFGQVVGRDDVAWRRTGFATWAVGPGSRRPGHRVWRAGPAP